MKTYCISDIHGHFSNLERFVETLNVDDKVFVLGDVIDKGPESIKCLEFIMNDSRFEMILGNHEHMMFDLLTKDSNSYEYVEAYNLWVNMNEGKDTLDQYNELPINRKTKIYNYIKELPLNIPNLKVNEKTFYLVHSCPNSKEQLYMRDVGFDEDEIACYVWDRVNPYDRLRVNDQIIIAGHTVVQSYLGLKTLDIKPIFDGDSIENAHYIDIDGGLATRLDNARLIAFCLDDTSYKLY